MTSKTSVRSIADTESGIAFAAAQIATTPELVFGALTSPEEIVRWWGSDGVYRTTKWNGQVRVGGAWRAEGVGADGNAFKVQGEFLTVDKPRKLSQTWKADWDEGKPTTVTYLLDAHEAGTRITVRHEGFKGQPEACLSYADSWGMVLGWLEKHFAPAENAARFFVLRLVPPRSTFPGDMTPEEGAMMQEHFAYWARLARDGTSIVYGPVEDPKGFWGLAVIRASDEEAARDVEQNDPAIKSGKGFHYDIAPMTQALLA